MLKQKTLQEVVNYLFISIGSFMLALGVVGLLAPNKIATGGTAGLAIIFHHLFNLPIGVVMILINIPLLLLGLRYVGKHFAIKSVIGILLIVAFIDFLAEIVQLKEFSQTPLLATLYGGVLVGVGLGFIFKGGGSAGGGTILAKIITNKFDVKTGTVIFVLDALVVCSAGWVFDSVELAMWSMISIFAASKLIDMVLTGKQTKKIVHISSFKNLDELSQNINDLVGVNGTVVKGDDVSAKEYKDILFIVVDKNQLSLLKNLVYQFDSKAKMIVMEASEMLEGK